ncbi:hypothetical protein MHPYR_180100 [uncultured Mycobacterium sp.]|uniref:Uncharacterized protein n=1 Tax=uncultured Mycobacterium sp. TaxID=171292 RepID=A0A1Y5P5C4_9MYCO|nr:hypothetical protein MHPYR_180100 [uncultured Mycobacterium sp.]
MSQFDTTGSECFPVGSPRIHLDSDGCNHRNNNACPACVELTDEEVAALREYFALLAAKRIDPTVGPLDEYRGE